MPAKKHYDAIVVGAGAAGAVFINRLAKAGLKVLAIEKGPFYRDHKNDFYESELSIFKLLWDNNQYRVSGSAFRGTPNLGKAVGGGTLVWTAVALRFFERDFTFIDHWGDVPGTSVNNWPIRLEDLDRFYAEAEIDMGVSGSPTVWDALSAEVPPNPPIPFYRSSYRFQQGFDRLGLNWAPGRLATNSSPMRGVQVVCIAVIAARVAVSMPNIRQIKYWSSQHWPLATSIWSPKALSPVCIQMVKEAELGG
jgi:choline dehydrogenase-like flavoprotein